MTAERGIAIKRGGGAHNLDKIVEGMAANNYDTIALSEIMILMPKNVSDAFEKWMGDNDKDTQKAKDAYFAISIEMNKALVAVDCEIEDLIS